MLEAQSSRALMMWIFASAFGTHNNIDTAKQTT